MTMRSHTLLCGECRRKRVWCIDLLLNTINIPLVAEGLQNRHLVLAFEAFISIRLLQIPYYIVSAATHRAQSLSQYPF